MESKVISPPQISLSLDPEGDTVTIKLVTYLGDKFADYRRVCAEAGARYVPSEKCNRAPVDAVPQLLEGFDAEGLSVRCDSALAQVLAARADHAKALLDSGRDRVEAVEQELAEKGLSLFTYQRTGIQWLAPRSRALLCDEMGLGKTVQALVALPERAAALIIVPAALKYNWEEETKRWRPDLTPVVIRNRETFRWPEAGEVLIASYGTLPGEILRDERNRVQGVEIDLPVPAEKIYLVADECHALKNRKAQRTARFRALAEIVAANDGVLWGITGTPLLNRPPELWSLLQTFGLAEKAFGSWYSFVSIFRGAKGRWGYVWGTPKPEAADRLRRVALRRSRTEVLSDLPTKIYRTVKV